MTVRASSQLGGGNTIVEYVVSVFMFASCMRVFSWPDTLIMSLTHNSAEAIARTSGMIRIHENRLESAMEHVSAILRRGIMGGPDSGYDVSLSATLLASALHNPDAYPLIYTNACVLLGQVFCSRCASNIIKGARFGQEGMVRVCNLCLDKLAKGDDDDDDDDRRSIITSISSPFAAHQFGTERSFNLSSHPQSPFAASQLFGRDEAFNLFSIAETKRAYAGSDDSGFGSRPMTPMDSFGPARFSRENPVPFRRAFTEEDKESTPVSDKFQRDDSPAGMGSKTPIDFPVMMPIGGNGATSTVQFPVSSPDQPYSVESPGVMRSRFNSLDLDGPPFIRSRAQSRLGESFSGGGIGEPGWRTRRESTA